MEEVGGGTGKRGRGIESFVRSSFYQASRRISPCSLPRSSSCRALSVREARNFMPAKVERRARRLHWPCEIEKKNGERFFGDALLFATCVALESKSSDDEKIKRKRNRTRKRVCDRFALPLLLQFPNTVLSAQLPVLPHSRAPGDEGKGTAASERRNIDVVDRRRRRFNRAHPNQSLLQTPRSPARIE